MSCLLLLGVVFSKLVDMMKLMKQGSAVGTMKIGFGCPNVTN